MVQKRRSLASVIGLVLLLAPLTACGDDAPASGRDLKVVTAFYPLELVARRVGGDLVTVTNVTPPGAEPHDLELKPSDVRTIREADLILYFGGGFQPSLEDAVEQQPETSAPLDLLTGLPLKQAPPGEDEGLEFDPHVWLDPALMKRIVDSIAGALAGKIPSGATGIRTNATALQSELSALDQEFTSKLAGCARHEIFTSHAAFGYLADRYGIRQIAIEGLSPEAEPSSRRLQEIARQAREAKATTIFFETLVSPRVAQAVARIVGAKTAVLDPIEGLTPEEESRGADYFSIMRRNLAALVSALGCRT